MMRTVRAFVPEASIDRHMTDTNHRSTTTRAQPESGISEMNT